MKKVILFILLAALLLTGCARRELSIDRENRTISDGKYTYTYTDITTSTGWDALRTVTIYAPNGATYSWHKATDAHGSYAQHTTSTGTYSGRYTDAEALLALILPEEQFPDTRRGYEFHALPFTVGLILLGLGFGMHKKPVFFCRVGLLLVVFCRNIPRHLIKWSEHWDNPPASSIEYSRAGGIVCMVLGGILVFCGVFGNF